MTFEKTLKVGVETARYAADGITPELPHVHHWLRAKLVILESESRWPFPKSDNENKYILVVSDYFTRWTEAFPIPNQEALTIARVFVNEYVCRYGVPVQLHTNQGRNFESKLIGEMCKILEIDKTRTSPYHP